MAAELSRLAEDLREQHYTVAARLVMGLVDTLSSEGLLPERLTPDSGVPLQSEVAITVPSLANETTALPSDELLSAQPSLESPIRGMSTYDIKAFNQSQVIRYLEAHGPTPRLQLATELGLARSTISHIMDDLTKRGVTSEQKVIARNRRGSRMWMVSLVMPQQPLSETTKD